MNSETIKQVQHFAAKVYLHPYAVLSIPYETKEDIDPPVEEVALSVSVDCPPKLKPFIIPYVIATQKARRGWHHAKPALITFILGDIEAEFEHRKSKRPPTISGYKRPLYGIYISKAPQSKDKFRFYINGLDVREMLLQDRALMRNLRQTLPPFFQRLKSLMRALRENDVRYLEENKGQSPIIELLRSLIYEFSRDDPRFYAKLRSLMQKLRATESDPHFYDKLGDLIKTIREQDPTLCKKIRLLMQAIDNRNSLFIEKLRLRVLTNLRVSLAIEPIDTKDIGDLYEKARDEKNRKKKVHYMKELRNISKEAYHRFKGVKELPNVSWQELQLRRVIASYYLASLKNT